jgi:uncharacterized membrane protein
MIRESLANKNYGSKNDFRWRGGEITRLETFSDAVFAFAITLLVVSLEVPNNFTELQRLMQGFAAFGISFTLLIFIWHSHYLFFRQYGLQDVNIIVLNSILLFVVLFYIYPLKFLFTLLVNQLLGLEMRPMSEIIQGNQVVTLMIIYSAGYFAVFFVFLLMHIHAYKLRVKLELNTLEIVHTINSIRIYIIHISVSILSILISIIGGAGFTAIAGFIYVLLGPAMAINGALFGKKLRKLKVV